jgi:hypothetical protein
MQKRQSNQERVILALLALLAIGVAGWLISLTLGFAGTLQAKQVSTRNESEPPPVVKVEEAIKRAIDVPKPWVAPIRNNKPVPLNKSVLLALKGEEVIDLFLEDPLLRPPMSNAYLRENSLEWNAPNVGDLDPDEDGFNNLEEFTKGTKPKSAQSHPPITDKLFMVERTSKDYRIILKSASAPHQVATPDELKKKNWFVDPNAMDSTGKADEKARSFGGNGDRFKSLKFERKVIPDPRTGEKDVSELTVEELVTKRNFVLVMGTELNLAEYSVKFEFRLKQVVGLAPVGKDGSFRIPGFEETTYRVVEIQEDNVVISPLKPDGTWDKKDEIIIKKG